MRVLLVAHGLPPEGRGGTEMYVDAFARRLRARGQDEVFVLARENRPDRPEYAVRREARDGVEMTTINHTFRDAATVEAAYRNPVIDRLAAAVLDEVRPDIVHVHHLTGLSIDVVDEVARRGIPVIFTLHDYWLICHRGQLLNRDLQRCEEPPEACVSCVGTTQERLAQRLRGLPGAGRVRGPMATRAAHMRAMCASVDRFLALSRTLRARFLDFGLDPEHVLYRPHGIDPAPFRGLVRMDAPQLRLGFLGSLMVSKAPHLLLEAVAGLPPGAVTVTLFGDHVPYHGDDRYRAQLAPLLARPGVRHVAHVPHAEVPRALAAVDVLVVPSIWIENAPGVIREAFASGAPVVASRLGGMAELVQHGVSGLLFEPGSVPDLRRALLRLIEEPGLLARLRAGIPEGMTLAEDVDWTRALYRDRLEASSRGRRPVAARARSATMAAVVVNHDTPAQTRLAVRSLLASQRPIQAVVVVDNGSAPGVAESLRAALPGVTVLVSGVNLGFSGGCNLGIREALRRGADHVLLINSDVVAPPDLAGTLERALAGYPGAGIAGPLVLDRADPRRVSSAGIRYDPSTGRMRHLGFGEPSAAWMAGEITAVNGVSGCAMLIARRVLDRVGLLDEAYFYSFEDLDLCLRARAAGFAALCVPGAVAYHEGSVSIGARSPRRVYFAARNHLRLASRSGVAPGAVRTLARQLSIVGLNVAHALVSAGVPRGRALRAVARGTWHHLVGRYGDSS